MRASVDFLVPSIFREPEAQSKGLVESVSLLPAFAQFAHLHRVFQCDTRLQHHHGVFFLRHAAVILLFLGSHSLRQMAFLGAFFFVLVLLVCVINLVRELTPALKEKATLSPRYLVSR